MATEGKKNKVLKIGNLELENPFLLAPLAGITDAPMRRIARELGAAMTYSEMVIRIRNVYLRYTMMKSRLLIRYLAASLMLLNTRRACWQRVKMRFSISIWDVLCPK